VSPYRVVTDNLIPSFSRNVKKLRRKYRRIDSDLGKVFDKIAEDPFNSRHATPLVGFNRTIWKYRCLSSDQKTGESGGFRILCYVDSENESIYPLAVWSKSQIPGQLKNAEIEKLIDMLSSQSNLE